MKLDILSHITTSVVDAHLVSIDNGVRVYSNEQMLKFIREYSSKFDQFLERSFAAAFAYNSKDMLVGTSFAASGSGEEPGADREQCFLYGNYVAPDHHGMHIGRDLLRVVKKEAVDRGYKTMSALATLFPGTLEFYRKNGFELMGREPREISETDFMFERIVADLTK
ncbi:MAG: GNAT family N-acetyltransferase [Nanoarchaeota archaeon]